MIPTREENSVFSDPKTAIVEDLVYALRAMLDRDEIDIVNMSIGYPNTTPDLDEVLSKLAKTKVLIAAGGKCY